MMNHQNANANLEARNHPNYHLSSASESMADLASRPLPLQFHAPADLTATSYAIEGSSSYGSTQSHGAERYMGNEHYKRSNSESFSPNQDAFGASVPRGAIRHSSFSMSDIKASSVIQQDLDTTRYASPPNVNMFPTSLNHPQNYAGQQAYPGFPMQPAVYEAHATDAGQVPASDMYVPAVSLNFIKDPSILPPQHPTSVDMSMGDPDAAPSSTMAVFGVEEEHRAPFASIPEDLVAYLFNWPQSEPSAHGTTQSNARYVRCYVVCL